MVLGVDTVELWYQVARHNHAVVFRQPLHLGQLYTISL